MKINNGYLLIWQFNRFQIRSITILVLSSAILQYLKVVPYLALFS